MTPNPKIQKNMTLKEILDRDRRENDAPISPIMARFKVAVDKETYDACQKLIDEKGPQILNVFAHYAINNEFDLKRERPFKFPGKNGPHSPRLKAPFNIGSELIYLDLVNSRKIVEVAEGLGVTAFQFIRNAMKRWSELPDALHLD